MSPKTCLTNCSQNYCPFVQDPENPRRYVCLKCGLERSLDDRHYHRHYHSHHDYGDYGDYRNYRDYEGDRPSAAILALLSVIVMLILI
ncbi:hypothetical protein PMG71_10210 [Roseofilum sp. BLCC_M154]|uniref:Uncharacterized protein n=1 Tax=Roseofilum acuticapitatum BLCC-M154 TaxID=3022444 RepID=A0ABT7ASC4_9CYAN|nr:hypothetical protein [Roseofilum acuticapitatum]MDJ1169799.1 hypothetical protein [Roseofilum acuticapitatum BLCC-M154]